ncbi:hypothetical protein [Synechococcus sp. SYN20]|nr:hypothetical protein [Synechococcus sp. SYN20]
MRVLGGEPNALASRPASAFARTMNNRQTKHLAGLVGVRDCWNPEPGGML